jgi:hypothetical protein
MIGDALALARTLAPARGAHDAPQSLAQASADLRSAQRLHRAAPAIGVGLGVVALVVFAHKTRR